MLKSTKCLLLVAISIVLLFYSSNVLAALDSGSLDAGIFAQIMIQNGVGQNIGHQLLENDYFGVSSFNNVGVDANNPAAEFFYDFSRNNNIYIVDNADRYTSDSQYWQGLHDMYADIVNQLRNQPEMAYLFQQADNYAGVGNDEYARAAIERITLEIMDDIIAQVVSAYNSGCAGKSAGKFTYKGKEYPCSIVASQRTEYSTQAEYGYQYLKWANDSILATVNVFQNLHGGKVSDDFDDKINQYNQSVTGNSKTPEEEEEENEEDDDEFEYSFSDSPSFYFPKLTNAIKFSNEFKNAGELEGISINNPNLGGQTIKEAIDGMVNDFGTFGTYIIYGVIIFFGVKTIWAGAHGKAEFKENIPIIILAIIFFYLAPEVVELAKDILDQNYGDKYFSGIWGSLIKIIQILAFGGIMFTGIKFLFAAGPDGRADVKSSLLAILIGCILVFASSTVVAVVINYAKDAGLKDVKKESSLVLEYKNVYYR